MREFCGGGAESSPFTEGIVKLNVVEQLPELIGPAFVYNRENKMIPFYFFVWVMVLLFLYLLI